MMNQGSNQRRRSKQAHASTSLNAHVSLDRVEESASDSEIRVDTASGSVSAQAAAAAQPESDPSTVPNSKPSWRKRSGAHTPSNAPLHSSHKQRQDRQVGIESMFRDRLTLSNSSSVDQVTPRVSVDQVDRKAVATVAASVSPAAASRSVARDVDIRDTVAPPLSEPRAVSKSKSTGRTRDGSLAAQGRSASSGNYLNGKWDQKGQKGAPTSAANSAMVVKAAEPSTASECAAGSADRPAVWAGRAKKSGLALLANPTVLNSIVELCQRIKECAVSEAIHRIRHDRQQGLQDDKFAQNFAYLLEIPVQSVAHDIDDRPANIPVPPNALFWSRERLPNWKLENLMETDAVIALRIADVFKQNTLHNKSSFVAHCLEHLIPLASKQRSKAKHPTGGDDALRSFAYLNSMCPYFSENPIACELALLCVVELPSPQYSFQNMDINLPSGEIKGSETSFKAAVREAEEEACISLPLALAEQAARAAATFGLPPSITINDPCGKGRLDLHHVVLPDNTQCRIDWNSARVILTLDAVCWTKQ